MVAHVLKSEKLDERLYARAIAVDVLLGSGCDLANNWGRITDTRRVIGRLFENLKVPVVKGRTTAVRRLRCPCVREREPAGQRYDLVFVRVELAFLCRVELAPAFCL